MHTGAPRNDAYILVDTDKIVGGSKLLGEMRDLIRRKHYSIRTEQAYLEWAKRYILFHGKRHPNEMGETQIVAFLSHLAVKRKVARLDPEPSPQCARIPLQTSSWSRGIGP